MFKNLRQLDQMLSSGGLDPDALLSYCLDQGMGFRLHPLGFIVCTFMIENSSKARLHLWPVGGIESQSDDLLIHDHVFSFKSWVLHGAVENIEYVRCSGESYSLYDTKYDAERSILTKLADKVALVETKRSVISKGESYHLNAAVFHETRLVSSNGAITVLITKPSAHDRPLVIGRSESRESHEFSRIQLSRSQVLSCYAELRNTYKC